MYIGHKISVGEWNSRRRRGFGGYGILIDNDTILDCRQCYEAGECYASAANCSKSIKHRQSNQQPTPNAKLVLRNEMIFLISTTDIYPSTEVLLDTYGDVYRV